MMHFGLTGYPLEHSLSPKLHEAALQACGLQGSYALYLIQPDDEKGMGRLVECIRTGELDGLNVTIPHKQKVMQFLDELAPAAEAIGAVNTIYRKDGKTVGDNTDARGFSKDLRRLSPNPKSAIILGAGGAARSVAHALREMGCEIVVAARRIEQARQLAERFEGVTPIELSLPAMRAARADLLVNTTPAGMYPDINDCPWPKGVPFPENAAIYDLVYNPPETLLVKRAHAVGLQATTGLGMLVEQAALAFELWTGYRVQSEIMSASIGHPAR